MDLAPAWLEEPLSAEATAERYIRPELRRAFLDLVARPVEEADRRRIAFERLTGEGIDQKLAHGKGSVNADPSAIRASKSN